MIIYIVGMGCVGKTTVGRMLAEKLGFTFFDLDEEVMKFYQKSIERMQNECLMMNEFREKASVVLDQLFSKDIDCVVAGTPAGLKFAYLSVFKRHKKDKELYSLHLYDTCENVLDRLKFYDVDSNPIEEQMSPAKRKRYLREIKADYSYFKSSYERADFQIDIENLPLSDIPDMICRVLAEQQVLPTRT
ncbi:Shikimate kinase [bioreactor metagenome]|uniref:Shikimate kinase n=1 Tax=bioreactor metagenome TaxID=1076179 RepID=A0A644WS32_9ZZZZ|nr:shikimate kinase [Sphaerochaeta sp.]